MEILTGKGHRVVFEIGKGRRILKYSTTCQWEHYFSALKYSNLSIVEKLYLQLLLIIDLFQ